MEQTYHFCQTYEQYVDFDADNIPAKNGYSRVTFVTDVHEAYATHSNPKATPMNDEDVSLSATTPIPWDEALAIVGEPARKHFADLESGDADRLADMVRDYNGEADDLAVTPFSTAQLRLLADFLKQTSTVFNRDQWFLRVEGKHL